MLKIKWVIHGATSISDGVLCWELEFVTIIVTWQLRVTVDSIHKSCDVFPNNAYFSKYSMFAWGKNPKNISFYRVYVCVRQKLIFVSYLLGFFCTFSLIIHQKSEIGIFCVYISVKYQIWILRHVTRRDPTSVLFPSWTHCHAHKGRKSSSFQADVYFP